MKGRDRNSDCWCGSGKKFKKCHLNRETQQRDNPWDAVEANRRAFRAKKCFASSVGLGPCDGGIIKAHTVSRGPNLSKIAKDGHVIQYSADVGELRKTGGQIRPKKIGIGDASVFFGFCSRHDKELFSAIENEAFTGRPDQCLTIAYRTMSRELYLKDASSHLRDTLRDADKGKSKLDQLIFQRTLSDIEFGNTAARKEAAYTHDLLTKAMIDKNSKTLKSIVLEFRSPLPFMFAGAWSPFTDLYDNPLQDGLADKLLQQVFFSSFAGTSGGYICISWIDVTGAPGEVIAKQIQAISCDKQASICLQLVAKHVENLFYNPDWHNLLKSRSRKQLETLFSSGLDAMGSIPSAPLQFYSNFGLPRTSKTISVQ